MLSLKRLNWKYDDDPEFNAKFVREFSLLIRISKQKSLNPIITSSEIPNLSENLEVNYTKSTKYCKAKTEKSTMPIKKS